MIDTSVQGKCKELSEAAVKADPTLTLVRGHYICPMWGARAHWWTTRTDGSIHDPTVNQFPTRGVGAEYVPFDGIVTCAECGKEFEEGAGVFDGNGHYGFCSTGCNMRFVGL